MKTGRCLVLACSPRRGGNTDTAAKLLADALSRSHDEGSVDIRRITEPAPGPCRACDACAAAPGSCVQHDAALPLLRDMAAASAACLISPIYFYHVPAQAKALMDRAQAFWHLPPELRPGAGRRLGVILLGARPRGDKLFSGALLSIRYMAEALGMGMADPLLLHGLDSADALRRRPDMGERVTEYGRALAAAL
ncbi:MAG: NAD(P)H-dependent oxidoreductase [Desulfovibrionaceae bacterium]|nr:NAD(P)H-dependent oxidoreductase [Desulfovibrionaceae bacterium]